jgi:GGDEF domain-containing protein
LVRDISERAAFEQQLHYQATHDALTGLPNRDHARNHLRLLLESNDADPRPISVLFVDLDPFKVVNDSRGHKVGDELLRDFGRRLRSAIDDGALCARFGATNSLSCTTRPRPPSVSVNLQQPSIERSRNLSRFLTSEWT